MKRPDPESVLDQIDATAAAWVGRRDGGLTQSEQRELENWCVADRRHREALGRFDHAWSELSRPRRTGSTATLARELSALKRGRRRQWVKATGVGLTAGLIVGLMGGLPRSPFATREVPAETTAVILMPERRTLTDGSVVEFPAGAEIVVQFTDAVRRVSLTRGEAHFQVAKNPARPFVVEAGGVEVRAVGTAFAVQMARAKVEVLVTEGSVTVDPVLPVSNASSPASEFSRPRATVTAGNRVVVDVEISQRPALPTPVVAVPESEIAERLAWRSPQVEFSGTPLSDVVRLLNRHNPVQFVIDDPRLGATALSGRFRIDDPAAFIRMLETGFGVSVEARGQQVFLRKRRLE